MKYLFLSISIICSINCIAQDPNPDLFQTWHLTSVMIDDLAPLYIVSEIDPPIQPYVTIEGNLSFSGQGACNTFDGMFEYFDPDYLETLSYANTTINCQTQVHNSLEDSFFWFMEFGGPFEISQDAGGLVLTMTSPLGGYAIFQNYPLLLPEFEKGNLKIYPNPSSSNIFISFQGSILTKVEIYSILGEKIKTVYDNLGIIDISELSSGIFLLKAHNSQGVIEKRIIKN